MDIQNSYKKISRLRTTDLLISKMDCNINISILKSLKPGLIGLIGVFAGQIVSMIYTGRSMMSSDFASAFLVVYCVIAYSVVTALEARAITRKELICDLLAIRMSRTAAKS